MSLQFEDNRVQVKAAMDSAITAFLHEAGGEIQARTIRNSRTDTGRQKAVMNIRSMSLPGNVRLEVTLKTQSGKNLGTGEYALKGNGRKGAWYVLLILIPGVKKPTYNGKVVIVYGKNGKKFYKTNGKTPNRPLDNAFKSLKTKLIKRFGQILTDKIGR